MIHWACRGERWLIATTVAMLMAIWAGELYHHLSIGPVALPKLLFELFEVVLSVGCATAGTLLVLRVRMREMAAGGVAMLALLLVGEAYLGVAPVTPSVLLVEALEVALLVGGSIAAVLLLRSRS
jgi:hypothetical protein